MTPHHLHRPPCWLLALAIAATLNPAASQASSADEDLAARAAAWDEATRERREIARRELDAIREQVDQARARFESARLQWNDGHAGFYTHDLCPSPDGEALVTVGDDGYAQLFLTRTGTHLGTLGRHSETDVTAEFSPDGTIVLVRDLHAARLTLWDGLSAEPLGQVGDSDFYPLSARFAPDGLSILTTDLEGHLRSFDSFTGLALELDVAFPGIRSLDLDPETMRALVLEASGSAAWVVGVNGEGLLGRTPESDVPWHEAIWNEAGDRILASARHAEGRESLLVQAVPAPDAAPTEPLFRHGTAVMSSVHAFTPDGRRALVSPEDGSSLQLVAVETGEVVQTIADVSALRIDRSPDGTRFLVLAGPGRAARLTQQNSYHHVLFIDAETGEVIASHDLRQFSKEPRVADWRWQPDSRHVVTNGGSWDCELQYYDVHTGERRSASFYPTGGLGDYEFLPGRDLILAAGERNLIEGYAPDSPWPAEWIRFKAHPIDALVALSDQRLVAATQTFAVPPDVRGEIPLRLRQKVERTPAGLRIVDPATGADVGRFDDWTMTIRALGVHPDGQRFLVGGFSLSQDHETRLALLHPDRESPEWLVPIEGMPAGLSFDGKGERILATIQYPTLVELRDGQGQVLTRYEAPFTNNTWHVCPAVFSPSAPIFASPSKQQGGNAIEIRSSQDGNIQHVLPANHRWGVRLIEFSPSGRLMISCGWDGRARLWDTESWKTVLDDVHTPPEEYTVINCAAFSKDERWVATGSNKGTLHLIDIKAGKTRALEGHTGDVNWVAFHPDGRQLFSASEDATLRSWDLETGRATLLEGHTSGVQGGLFLDEGRRLVSRSSDTSLCFWDLQTGSLLATRLTFRDGEWLVLGPNGHYAGTDRAADWTRLRIHEAWHPLSGYASFLNKPDKVQAAFSGEPAAAPTRLPRPPAITLTKPERGEASETRRFLLEVLAEDPTGIVDFQVFQDEVFVPAELVAAATTASDRGRKAQLSLELSIPDGETSTTFRVRATNRRGVGSLWRSGTIELKAESRELYFLALGVADYDDEKLDLTYPVQDVDDLVAAFQKQEGRFYSKVHVERLVDAEVTMPAVRRLRDQFLLRAKENDTIVIFVAGHGVRTDTNEYWFLTATATPDNPYTGLDRRTIEDLVMWDKLHAKRRILMIDTCHSGAAFGRRGLSKTGLFDQAYVDRLRQESRNGIYILAASADDEFAQEQSGNGLFTRAILDALTPSGDENGNRMIEVEELMNFAKKQVHERSGGKQVPTFPLVEAGEDFPIGQVIE